LKKCKILYHVTTADRVENILREGLLPRAEGKTEEHPPRVYFIQSPIAAVSIAFQIRRILVRNGNIKRTDRGEFVVLAVSRTLIPGHRFRRDKKSVRECGIHTAQGIHPAAIRVYERIPGEKLMLREYLPFKWMDRPDGEILFHGAPVTNPADVRQAG